MAISKPPKAFWPIKITAGVNDAIPFGMIYEATVFIAPGTYYTVDDFAEAARAAIQSGAGGAPPATVSITDGRITFASLPPLTRFFWASSPYAATSARALLGFPAVDSASGTTHTATSQHMNGWYPGLPCTFDSREEYERLATATLTHTGVAKHLFFGAAKESRRIAFAWLPEWKTKIAREGAYTNEALERLWLNGSERFRWWPDATVEGTYSDLSLDSEVLRKFMPDRDERLQLYTYVIRARKFV